MTVQKTNTVEKVGRIVHHGDKRRVEQKEQHRGRGKEDAALTRRLQGRKKGTLLRTVVYNPAQVPGLRSTAYREP